ncbi:MAG: hypothetical protein WCC90_13400, partial [Methylocella sp.]
MLLRDYLSSLFKLAFKSSWELANGLFGAALGGGIMIWRGALQIINSQSHAAESENWVLSFLLYSGVAWAILLVFRFIFISPFELWRNTHNEVARLRKENAELEVKVDGKESRRDRADIVATIIKEGNLIAKTFEDINDKELIILQYKTWEHKAISIISNKLGDSYA